MQLTIRQLKRIISEAVKSSFDDVDFQQDMGDLFDKSPLNVGPADVDSADPVNALLAAAKTVQEKVSPSSELMQSVTTQPELLRDAEIEIKALRDMAMELKAEPGQKRVKEIEEAVKTLDNLHQYVAKMLKAMGEK